MRPIPEVKPLLREQMMLSFEVIESGKAIQICADDEGLRVLRKALERVTSAGHLHLRTIANGGNELNDANPWGQAAVGEVIITAA
jgi:hypothetical protein